MYVSCARILIIYFFYDSLSLRSLSLNFCSKWTLSKFFHVFILQSFITVVNRRRHFNCFPPIPCQNKSIYLCIKQGKLNFFCLNIF